MTLQVIAPVPGGVQNKSMTMTESVAASTAAELNLRKVLQVNGALSTTTGLAGLIFGGAVADLLGVDQVWMIRLLGAGLAGFAAFVILISLSNQSTLRVWSAQISLADIAWVVGTVIVIALGWLSTSGAVVMAVIGLGVLGLGLAQWRLRSEI